MKILFVCLGNICRSPALHHLMKKKIEDNGDSEILEVDSCAISSWNLGDDVDPRMLKEAEKQGALFPKHKAKLFKKKFYKEYDYIFVVTEEIRDHLKQSATKAEAKKVLLATHFSSTYKGKEIPDPYYGSQTDFKKVYKMIETVVDETFLQLKKQL